MADESDVERASRETRLAIEIVTVWMPAWETRDFGTRAEAYGHVHRVRAEEGDDTIFSGQLNLIMLLLKKLAEKRGAASQDTLWAEIEAILLEISRDLPA